MNILSLFRKAARAKASEPREGVYYRVHLSTGPRKWHRAMEGRTVGRYAHCLCTGPSLDLTGRVGHGRSSVDVMAELPENAVTCKPLARWLEPTR